MVQPGVASKPKYLIDEAVKQERLPPTEREAEVLQLLADGYEQTQVADLLAISYSTVRTHVENLRNKWNVNTTIAVVACAFREKWIT